MDMNGLNQSSYVNAAANNYQTNNLKDVSGRTIGEPKLSEKALKYYEKLKKKYSNMDFILVAADKKEEAERNKGMYKSTKELLVLIDVDKIERMAEDEAYRKKYEGILSGATAKITQMRSSLGTNANKVSSFGMTFNDHGNASFFAVVDKSLALQREKIAAKREASAKEKKQEAKKAAEKKREEKLREKQTAESGKDIENTDKVTVTANSWDELLKKIDDVIMADMADNILTENERKVGQSIDYAL